MQRQYTAQRYSIIPKQTTEIRSAVSEHNKSVVLTSSQLLQPSKFISKFDSFPVFVLCWYLSGLFIQAVPFRSILATFPGFFQLLGFEPHPHCLSWVCWFRPHFYWLMITQIKVTALPTEWSFSDGHPALKGRHMLGMVFISAVSVLSLPRYSLLWTLLINPHVLNPIVSKWVFINWKFLLTDWKFHYEDFEVCVKVSGKYLNRHGKLSLHFMFLHSQVHHYTTSLVSELLRVMSSFLCPAS